MKMQILSMLLEYLQSLWFYQKDYDESSKRTYLSKEYAGRKNHQTKDSML